MARERRCSVRELQQTVTPEEFLEWVAFQTIDPGPELLGAALIACQLHNMFADRAHQITPSDVLGLYKPPRDPDDIERELFAFFGAMAKRKDTPDG